MNYYPHHIGDYITATAHLTMLEDGAYRRLLDLYYSTERALPLDRRALHRLVRARTQEEQDAVDIVIAEFFDETQDGWTHSRCDEEIEKARVAAERARTNGKRGGRPPKAEPSDNPEAKPKEETGNPEETQSVIPGLAKPNPEETQGEPSDNPEAKPPIPIPIPIPKEEKEISSGKPDLPPGFVAFWELWPKTDRKTAKAKCVERWRKSGLEEISTAILAHVRGQKASNRDWRDGFEPAPLTYLNQRRWEDGEGGVSGSQGGDDTAWWLAAGFSTETQAVNDGCTQRSAWMFKDGKQVYDEYDVEAYRAAHGGGEA